MMDISSLFQNAALPLVLLAAALDVTANMLLVRSSSYGFGRGLRHVGRFWRAWHIRGRMGVAAPKAQPQRICRHCPACLRHGAAAHKLI